MSHPNIRFLDRAKETTTTTGSGAISLGGAVAGFVGVSGIGNGNSTYYTLQEGNNFEIGIGTYATAGNTLSRDEVFSSSNSDDSKIDLAGSTTVFITYPADKAVVKTSGNYVGIGIDPEYQLQVSGTGSFNTVRWADGTTQTTADTDTTYTAGTGLSLGGTEFNVSGIDGTMIVDGSIANTDLENSSLTITAGTGLSNGGLVSLGGSVTVDADTASTSAVGVVQLQDSATDGTTDKAITPNAVYDISGVLSTNISSTGATNASSIATNTSNISTNTANISTNATNIASTGATNAANIATNTSNISTNTSNISTNTTNIASTGSTNASDINTVSGLLYDNWTLQADGATTTSVDTAETVRFTGAGNTSITLGGTDNRVVTISGSSAGGGAPTDAQYVTLALDGDLSAERVLAASTGVHIVDGGANGNVTVSVSGSTTSQLGIVQLQDFATDGTIDKAITPNAVYDISGVLSTSIATTGAINAVLIATNTTNIATNVTNIASTGATNAAAIAAKDNYRYWTATDGGTTSNISTTEDVKITGAGQVTVSLASGPNVFTVSGAAAGGGAPTDAQYITLALDGDLSAERVLTAGNGIHIVDGGANGNVTVSVSGSTTSQLGIVQLQDSATDGTTDKAITPNAVYDISGVLSTSIASTGATNAANIATNTSNISTNTSNISTNTSNISTNTTNIALTGATNAANIAANTSNISTNTSNISTNATNIASTGATNAANIATNTSNISTNTSNISTNTGNISTNTSNISTNTTNIASTGATNSSSISTVSGLLYDYWTLKGDASTTTNVDTTETVQFIGAGNTSITLGGTDNRTVTISGSGGGGGTTYTAGTGLTLVDLTEFNANTSTTSAVGVVQLQDSATDGTTDKAITPNAVYDISGVLQTNMAATGVTNGALIATNVTNIASTGATNAAAIAAKDNYQYWTATDGNTTSNISTTEDVKITGAGQVTVSLASGSPSVFTVSGEGAPTDAQYVTLATDGDLSAERVLTAGSGIRIVDAGANGAVTLHGSGISLGGVTADLGSTDATPIFNLIDATGYLTSRLVGDIDNSQLANSSITVTAATGLAVVGSPVSLGGTITLATAQTGYFMKLGINDTTPDAMVDIVSDNDSTIGLIIQAAPSQSENMIETRLFDGETRFTIAQNGNMVCNAITATGTQIKLGSVNTSPTIRVAAGGNNLNIRNLNADKDINLDIAESGNFVQIRTYLGGTASTRVQWEDNGVRHDKASSYGDIFAAGDASTVTFDLAQSNVHTVTLGGSRTLAIASGNAGQKFMIRLTQDGAGGRSGIWFSAIRWAGGSPPVQGESANKSSLYGFLCTAGGYYDGFIIGSGII